MPRPRFQKLDAVRQAAIIDSATREFAEHGFSNASFNRIIENAGLSKGAMYYYFDDKKDLFMTVIRSFQARIVAELPILEEVRDAEDYWLQLEAILLHAGEVKKKNPEFIRLAFNLFKAVLNGEVLLGHNELFEAGLEWAKGLFLAGQKVGAVRQDAPADLLVSMAFGVFQAVDLWFLQNIERFEQINYEAATVFSLGLIRRLLAPGPDSISGESLLNGLRE